MNIDINKTSNFTLDDIAVLLKNGFEGMSRHFDRLDKKFDKMESRSKKLEENSN